MIKKNSAHKGFTLIELLIVIAIIAIIAAVVFVALDPLTRFKDSRDAARWSDISGILSAIKIDQVDNGGYYLSAVDNLNAGEVYMVTDGSGTPTGGCDNANANCDTPVTSETAEGDHCVDLSPLVDEGYLGSIPVSPDGLGSWGPTLTGYTIEKSSTGIITLRACESENAGEIKAAR